MHVFQTDTGKKIASQCKEFEKNYVLVLPAVIKTKIIFLTCFIQGIEQLFLFLFLYIARIFALFV